MRTLLLFLALCTTGCSSQLARINEQEYVGNCQDHVRSRIALIEHRYSYQVLRTCTKWMPGCHVSLLVFSEDGPVILDNGALLLGTKPIPFNEAAPYLGKYALRSSIQSLTE